ncbi:MAG: endolytic transglycosylase MltG [Geminicoccaceae bacterium]
MTRALKLLAGLSMLVALAGIVVVVAWTQLDAYLARPGPAGQETTVILPRGAGVAEIAKQLAQARVIAHPLIFRLAVRAVGRDRDLQAGEYAFPAHATPRTVIGMLAGGQTVARRLTVPEGLTVSEILRMLEETEGLTGALPTPPPEGSLLPETYFYAYGDSRAGLVHRMRRAMTELMDELWPGRAEGLPLASRRDALILASIVDKETAIPDERRKVAAVFLNRLTKGMRLQSDPTVIYGLTGGDGPLGRGLTRQDWDDDSDFNTYRIDGLPPAPIGNPGRQSIEAVLDPADVDYLYFVADGTGGHAFASTLAEHNRNVAHWRRIKHAEQPRSQLRATSKPEG